MSKPKIVNVKVTCANEFERKAILRAVADPRVYELLLVIGALLPLEGEERRACIREVMDQLAKPPEGNL